MLRFGLTISPDYSHHKADLKDNFLYNNGNNVRPIMMHVFDATKTNFSVYNQSNNSDENLVLGDYLADLTKGVNSLSCKPARRSS